MKKEVDFLGFKRVKAGKEKIGEFLNFLAETSKEGKSMRDHPFNKMNDAAIRDVKEPYPKRAIVARRLIDTKRKAKLLSPSENTSVQVTPDGASIIFQSMKHGHTNYWPVSNWIELRDWLNLRISQEQK